MEHYANISSTSQPRRDAVPKASLRHRAEDVLTSTAVLALLASVSDGEPDPREVSCLVTRFKRRYALHNRSARRLISGALQRVCAEDPVRAFNDACDTLNEYLTVEQRLELIDDLADIIVADQRVDELEEHFLDFVVLRLGLVSTLAVERNS